MNSHLNQVLKLRSLVPPLHFQRATAPLALRWGRLRWFIWLVASLVCGALSAPALAADEIKASATLYVSKIALDKRPDPKNMPGADAKLNFYCFEDLARLKQEKDGMENEVDWPRLEACAGDRYVSHKADDLRIVYVDWQKADTCVNSSDVVVLVKETYRKTAVSAGLSYFIKGLVDKANNAAMLEKLDNEPKPKLCFTPIEQALVLDRATAEVTVSLKSAPDDKASKEIITGPAEHLFLSGDAIVKGAKELKYDPDKKAIFSRDKPEQLYLGINWMMGDVYSRYQWLSEQRLVAKLMILPSRHPFDSVGVGIGYRFADGVFDVKTGLQPTGGFVAFAGHFWTKNDAVDAAGNPTQGDRSRSWRVGVSYGLDSLLGWLK